MDYIFQGIIVGEVYIRNGPGLHKYVKPVGLENKKVYYRLCTRQGHEFGHLYVVNLFNFVRLYKIKQNSV